MARLAQKPPAPRSGRSARFRGWKHRLWTGNRRRLRDIELEAANAQTREFDADRLQSWQTAHVSELIDHCRTRVPAYRRAWPELDPQRVSLNSLPTVTKQDISRSLSAFVSTDIIPGSLKATNSGGASGRRTLVLRSADSYIANSAIFRRIYASAGIPRQATIAYLNAGWKGADRVYSADHGDIDYAWVGVERLTRTAGLISRMNPDALIGSPHFLLSISRQWNESTDRHPSGVVMFSSFEYLPHAIRGELEAAGFIVRNLYAASEMTTPIAFECEMNRLHVNSDYCLLEIVDEDGQPTDHRSGGAVAVTDLANRTMPIVRYLLGDVVAAGRLDPCSCGRALPTMPALEGRSQAGLMLADGSTVSSQPMIEALRDIVTSTFSLIQSSATDFELQVFDTNEPPNLRDEVAGEIARQGGQCASLNVSLIDPTQRYALAKHSWFLSRVPRRENT